LQFLFWYRIFKQLLSYLFHLANLLQRPCFIGLKMAFSAAGALWADQQQPRPRRQLSCCSAPSNCRHTEHAVAVACCLSDTSTLDPQLAMLLHCSYGVIPRASDLINHDADVSHLGAVADSVLQPSINTISESLVEDVLPQGSGGLVAEVARGSPEAVRKVCSVLSKQHLSGAARLRDALATQRQSVRMVDGLSWAEYICLLQFSRERLLNTLFRGVIGHAGRVLACFHLGSSLCSVDSLGWIKWYLNVVVVRSLRQAAAGLAIMR
jgi:hypothetical protein